MAAESILDLIFHAHRWLSDLETTPRDYGTGELLYSSDIHTIEEIARREGSNLTELASALVVTLPAAFKFVGKLVHRGYVVKKRREDNAKEVIFFLSEKGRLATKAHRVFSAKTFGPLWALEETLSPNDRQVILGFLAALNQAQER